VRVGGEAVWDRGAVWQVVACKHSGRFVLLCSQVLWMMVAAPFKLGPNLQV